MKFDASTQLVCQKKKQQIFHTDQVLVINSHFTKSYNYIKPTIKIDNSGVTCTAELLYNENPWINVQNLLFLLNRPNFRNNLPCYKKIHKMVT